MKIHRRFFVALLLITLLIPTVSRAQTSLDLLRSFLNILQMQLSGAGGGMNAAPRPPIEPPGWFLDEYDANVQLENHTSLSPTPNQDPIAHAGADQTLAPGVTQVTLNGSLSSDSDGQIVSYVWRRGSSVVGLSVNPTISSLAVGTHTITLTVIDDDGARDTDSVNITITAAPDPCLNNQAPTAVLQGPATGEINQNLLFSGFLSTDPETELGSLQYRFTFGDGVVSEWQSATADIFHHYTAAGIYTVSLEVRDSCGAIDVSEPRQVDIAPNQAPVADAGPDQVADAGSLVSFYGNNSYDPDLWGAITEYHWDFGDGASMNGQSAFHVYSTPAIYTATLTVTDDGGAIDNDTALITVSVSNPCANNNPPTASAGLDQTINEDTSVFFAGSGTDTDGTITSYVWDFGDGDTGNGATPTHVYTTPGSYFATLTVTDNCGATSSDQATVTVTSSAPAQVPPRVNAGVDQSNLSFPTTVSLTGSVVGFPAGYSVVWTKVAGPGTVNFSNGSGLQTNATFSAAGLYTLKLTATSGSLTRSDTVQIVFNQTVSVNAGPDRILNLSTSNHQGSITLDASVTASDPAPLSYSWSQVSGPSQLSITDNQIADIAISSTKAGTYVLRLLVSGPGVIPVQDTMTLFVRDLEAGETKTVVWPATATLSGVATNFPTDTTYQWSQQSGPANGAVFSPPNSLSTTVSFPSQPSASGDIYQLRLTATPPGESPIIDTVQVNVNPTGSLGVNAGPDQLNLVFTSPSATINLTGTAVNVPSGTAYKWTRTSGPAAGVVFSPSDTVLSPTVTLTQAGNYTFQLKATPPAGVQMIDSVNITFNLNPTNVLAEASPHYLTWPNDSTSLNTHFSDSNPGVVNAAWTQYSGPTGGNTTFANENAFDTTATFNQTGQFGLRVVLNDGLAFSPQDEISVNVYPACDANNQPPVASGSYDQWAQVNHPVPLSGSAPIASSDSDGLIASHYWDFGDGSFAVGSSLSHSYSQPGTYTATLTVADNCGQVATKEIKVHVIPVTPGAFNPILKLYKLETVNPITGEENWTELVGNNLAVSTGDFIRFDLLSSTGSLGLFSWSTNAGAGESQSFYGGLANFIRFIEPSDNNSPYQLNVTVYSEDFSSQVNFTRTIEANNLLTFLDDGSPINGENSFDVAVDGNLAFTAHNNSLLSKIDITNLPNIQVVNSVSAPGGQTAIAASNNHVYVGAGNQGIFIYRQDDLDHLTTYNTSGQDGQSVRDLYARGKVVIVAAGNPGIKVLDMTNPAQPNLIANIDLPLANDSASRLVVTGSRLYVSSVNRVYVYDISGLNFNNPQPFTLQLLGTLAMNAPGVSVFGIYVSGDILLVDGGGKMFLYSLVDLSNIVQVGYFDPGIQQAGMFSVFDGRAYFTTGPISGYGTSVFRVDVANPSSPQIVETLSPQVISGTLRNPVLHDVGGGLGKVFFYAASEDVIVAIDVAD